MAFSKYVDLPGGGRGRDTGVGGLKMLPTRTDYGALQRGKDLVGYLGKGPGVAAPAGTSKSFSGRNAPKEMSAADKAAWNSHASKAHAGVQAHASDVKGGGGGHGGNPNHDERGRFA